MMTTTLRVLLILASLGTFALMMHKIRRSKVQIESSIFWIVLALVLVVYSVFPPVADFCARLLGIYATTNFLFVLAIFVLIVKVFYMTNSYLPARDESQGTGATDGTGGEIS
ncbi:MAG: DUF2304 domain-containing protein [Lachnospiraceae bacterium]